MERFLSFVASPAGRWARIAGGTVLFTVALSRRGPRVVILPASVMLLSGIFDFVPPARAVGLPMRGPALRRRLGMAREAPLFGS